MADQRISELFEISSSGVASNDVLPIVDTNVSQTKKVTAKALAEAGFRLADDATLSAAKLTATGITSDKLADGAVTTAKLAATGITSAKIADGAVGTTQLAAIGVTTAKIEDGAVTFAKIQDIATNTLIGRSTAGTGDAESISCTAAGRSVIGAADAAAQRTALGLGNISLATGTWANGATVSGTNTGDQTITLSGDATGTGTAGIAVTITAGAVGTSKIADSGVTTAKVADGAITGAKLADNSAAIVATAAPVSAGSYVGQQYLDATTNIEYTWTGEEWRQQAGLTTVTFPTDALFAYDVDLSVANAVTVSGTLNTQPATLFFAGPVTGADDSPTFRAIATTDLPVATNSTLGIAGPGSGLTINANGIIDHSNNIDNGTYYKVTVDGNGHVTSGTTVLIDGDIPSLDASKITTGTFASAFIAEDAIDGTKIADRIVCNFGETRPAAGEFVGQFFYDPINQDTYVWDSNVWQPISVTAGAIVLAGLYDASVNEIVSLTGAGAAVSGFTISGAIPAAESGNSGYYFLVNASGVGSGNAPNVTLIPPDLIISDGTLWYEVDVSSSYVSQNAASISFTPSGDIGATTVQAAIEEVSSECRNASNITGGTLAIARGGTGIGSYTTGDLIVGSGSTLVKLPVGTNTHVLTADSTAGGGMKWAAATNGTVTSVSGVSPLSVSSPTTAPIISIASATTSSTGVVQLTNSTSTTSSTLAATATAVKSAYDLANAALPKSGGTMTGNLQLNSSSSVVFQGTSFNTTLNIVNPSAARTISLPNVGGTIVTTSGTGVVSNAMIANGIAGSKISFTSLETLTLADDFYIGQRSSVGSSTNGDRNTLLGVDTQRYPGLGCNDNVAIGYQALKDNEEGISNVAVGSRALTANLEGSRNTAVGYVALQSITSGFGNVAVGNESLTVTQTSSGNTAIGTYALAAFGVNSEDPYNTAVGYYADTTKLSGSGCVAVGAFADTDGSNSVCVGVTTNAGSGAIAVGADAVANTNSTALGAYTLVTGTNSTVIGASASGTANNQITLGNSSITSLRCAVQTISALSDARDKTDIDDLGLGIHFIDKLRPVSFTWQTREGIDTRDGTRDCGFLAQDLLEAQSDDDAEFLNLVLQANPDRLEASYGRLMPVVVQALKDVSAELKTIKQELAQLKGEA